MKNLEKHFGTAAVVAGGVFLAGFLLNTFRNNPYVAQIRGGFAGL